MPNHKNIQKRMKQINEEMEKNTTKMETIYKKTEPSQQDIITVEALHVRTLMLCVEFKSLLEKTNK